MAAEAASAAVAEEAPIVAVVAASEAARAAVDAAADAVKHVTAAAEAAKAAATFTQRFVNTLHGKLRKKEKLQGQGELEFTELSEEEFVVRDAKGNVVQERREGYVRGLARVSLDELGAQGITGTGKEETGESEDDEFEVDKDRSSRRTHGGKLDLVFTNPHTKRKVMVEVKYVQAEYLRKIEWDPGWEEESKLEPAGIRDVLSQWCNCNDGDGEMRKFIGNQIPKRSEIDIANMNECLKEKKNKNASDELVRVVVVAKQTVRIKVLDVVKFAMRQVMNYGSDKLPEENLDRWVLVAVDDAVLLFADGRYYLGWTKRQAGSGAGEEKAPGAAAASAGRPSLIPLDRRAAAQASPSKDDEAELDDTNDPPSPPPKTSTQPPRSGSRSSEKKKKSKANP